MEHINQNCFDALKRGDEEACARTFRHYHGFACYVAQRCGVDNMTRDDVIQNAFIKLYQHAESLQSPQSIAQWLAITIRNLCFDEFRKQSRARRKADAFVTHQQTFGNSPSETELFEGQIYKEAIKALDDVSGGDTLRAFYLEGLSVEEIASRDKQAIGTVTARLSRARKKLRETLVKRMNAAENSHE